MRPPKSTILRNNHAAFEPPKPDKGSGTEQSFRGLPSDVLFDILEPGNPRLDRLAARTILLERGYDVPDPFVPTNESSDKLSV